MTLMDERGRIHSGGWVAGGDAANLEAFTDTGWVTVRGDSAPYPF